MIRNRGLFNSETKSAEKMNMRLEATQEELEQEEAIYRSLFLNVWVILKPSM
jgi:hypothetical protein